MGKNSSVFNPEEGVGLRLDVGVKLKAQWKEKDRSRNYPLAPFTEEGVGLSLGVGVKIKGDSFHLPPFTFFHLSPSTSTQHPAPRS